MILDTVQIWTLSKIHCRKCGSTELIPLLKNQLCLKKTGKHKIQKEKNL
jgi:hypothetical protein